MNKELHQFFCKFHDPLAIEAAFLKEKATWLGHWENNLCGVAYIEIDDQAYIIEKQEDHWNPRIFNDPKKAQSAYKEILRGYMEEQVGNMLSIFREGEEK